MRARKLLVAFLLAVGLCLMPALGYGELHIRKDYELLDYNFLRATVHYIMHNPTTFLEVQFDLDEFGLLGIAFNLPEDVDTEGRICVEVRDHRDIFSEGPEKTLLDQFKRELEVIYSFIDDIATDLDGDVVAVFYSGGDIPLGYFYQGEYHLWESSHEG